jgi:uncharacterized protein YdcH (DUF465 family)
MEKRDLELIEKYISVDDELRKYVEEHGRFEEFLEEFDKRIHLTPEEEMKQKGIKKLKLKGRDKIEQILAKYRQQTADI